MENTKKKKEKEEKVMLEEEEYEGEIKEGRSRGRKETKKITKGGEWNRERGEEERE